MLANSAIWEIAFLEANDIRLTLQVAKTVNERISKYAQVTLESSAYAGTGNVLKVQQLLAQAGEHIELKDDESWKVRCIPCHMVTIRTDSGA